MSVYQCLVPIAAVEHFAYINAFKIKVEAEESRKEACKLVEKLFGCCGTGSGQALFGWELSSTTRGS